MGGLFVGPQHIKMYPKVLIADMLVNEKTIICFFKNLKNILQYAVRGHTNGTLPVSTDIKDLYLTFFKDEVQAPESI